MRLSLALFCLTALGAPLEAQRSSSTPELVSYFRGIIELESPYVIREPTILILIDLGPNPLTLDQLEVIRAQGDSIKDALTAIADRRGYTIAIRATTYRGAIDPAFNLRIAPAPERGRGILLLGSGKRPSRLLPYLAPAALAQEITEYDTPFRPLYPS